MILLPPKPARYPENSPIADPIPPASAIHKGSKVPPRVKITTVYGIGKKIDNDPIRLIKKIPKYPCVTASCVNHSDSC